MSECAVKVIKDNGLANRITVIPKRSTELTVGSGIQFSTVMCKVFLIIGATGLQQPCQYCFDCKNKYRTFGMWYRINCFVMYWLMINKFYQILIL
jgi:hypothetical protein